MAIELYSPHVAFQKLDYIHNNPLTGAWQLAKEPSDYSSHGSCLHETIKSFEKVCEDTNQGIEFRN